MTHQQACALPATALPVVCKHTECGTGYLSREVSCGGIVELCAPHSTFPDSLGYTGSTERVLLPYVRHSALPFCGGGQASICFVLSPPARGCRSHVVSCTCMARTSWIPAVDCSGLGGCTLCDRSFNCPYKPQHSIQLGCARPGSNTTDFT